MSLKRCPCLEQSLERLPRGSTWKAGWMAAWSLSAEQIQLLHWFPTQLGKCVLVQPASSCALCPARLELCLWPEKGDLFPREASPAPVDRFVAGKVCFLGQQTVILDPKTGLLVWLMDVATISGQSFELGWVILHTALRLQNHVGCSLGLL